MKAGLFACLAMFALCGCEKAVRNMYDDARRKPLEASRLFTDHRSDRPEIEGTLAHSAGVIAQSSSGTRGVDRIDRQLVAENATTIPYPLDAALLERGHERFAIYCAPCHSPLGDGDGRVARRGFPHPPSYHIERLREAPDRHFYDVITQGYGVMYSYADRVPPDDRWAIVAYIRQLQREGAGR